MENEVMNDLVFVGIPRDVVIVSGFTPDTPVQITATDGSILIELVNDNSECICDDCRINLEIESEEKS